MITPMKRITVITLRVHQEASLMALQELGVLHLEHIQEPGGTLLDEARAHVLDVRRAREVLEHYQAEAEEKGDKIPLPDDCRTAESVVDEVWKLLNHKKDFEESLDYWKREQARLQPFGNFDPEKIRELAQRDIYITLYKAGPNQAVDFPEDVSVTHHGQDRQGAYFTVVSRKKLDLPCEIIRLPECSPKEIEMRINEIEQALADNEKQLKQCSAYVDDVREIAFQAEDRMQFLEARTGMGAAKPLAYLRGYCPGRDVEKIRKIAKPLGWGVIIEDAPDDAKVPTKIETPKWVHPIRVIFGFIGVVPGYREVDISALFLLFFSLFFAMIVGDAGYGALFLGATLWAHRRFKKAPAAVFHLLYITGIGTVIWGVLTGNYFGFAGALPGPLESIQLKWLLEMENMMFLCFLIGAIHLTLAHGWNVIRTIRSTQALAQLGWISIVWFMFFLASNLVLNKPFPPFIAPVAAVGLVLLVLFMTPFKSIKSEWFNHVMLPLNLVSNFVDVVSYVRLFAVGTATLAVASAFNGMAADMASGGVFGKAAAALVLLAGHTLNILLAAMGVLVHGIRLNTLEFAGHLGLQWTGIRFSPFARKARKYPFLMEENQLNTSET
jgi:V/A-type H+/Na+-transporting ATPase subunit I